jgi:hypothetical protein
MTENSRSANEPMFVSLLTDPFGWVEQYTPWSESQRLWEGLGNPMARWMWDHQKHIGRGTMTTEQTPELIVGGHHDDDTPLVIPAGTGWVDAALLAADWAFQFVDWTNIDEDDLGWQTSMDAWQLVQRAMVERGVRPTRSLTAEIIESVTKK